MRCGTRLARPDAHITGAAAVLIAASSFALAQDVSASRRFEAVSIHPMARLGAAPGPLNTMRGGPGTNDPSRIVCRGVSVILLARRAYDIAPFQLIAPQWLLELPPEQAEGHFDITATLPPNSTQEDLRLMLQNLLTERFDFRSHRERRAIPAFVVAVARKGFKLKDEPGTAHGIVNTSLTHGVWSLQTKNGPVPISSLVEMLSRRLNSPVIDRTELTGQYSFRLDFTLDLDPASDAAKASPTLFEALEHECGLKLEKSTQDSEVLVIDRVAKVPTEN